MTGSGWGANNHIYYNKLSKMSSFQQKITRHTNRKPIQQGEKKRQKKLFMKATSYQIIQTSKGPL